MTIPATKTIALALSGGGIRAMAFHMGVLQALSERSLLEVISKISTVSGGSLILGLILQENKLQWPTSSIFLKEIYPALRKKLCERSLQWGAARQLANPSHWRFLLSRSNLLALALQNEWQIVARLSDIPSYPEWSINGTTAENGKRFRFKRENIGDYTLGYASADTFPLAQALAVSAAFPGGFGPLVLDAQSFIWKWRAWNAPQNDMQIVDIRYSKLHLYDGGIYDNLGIEPFFDAGKIAPKQNDAYIIVSDAGSPLPSTFSYSYRPFSPFRLKRVADIISEQSRSLRVRAFSTYIQQTKNGSYFYIKKAVDKEPCASSEFAIRFPTTLRRLTLDEFDKLAGHGYAVTKKVEMEYGLYPTSHDLEAAG